MGKYYNTQRGPLAVSLSSGKALTCPPKSWISIDPGDEGSASVQAMVRKGYLKRSALPDAPAVEEAPAAPAAPAPAPVSAAKAAPPSLPPSDEKDLPAAPKPMSMGGKTGDKDKK